MIKLKELLNEQRVYRVTIDTPFYVFYGGSEIEGQCKWVIETDDGYENILDDFIGDGEDQLWCSRQEAIETVQDWWKINFKKYDKT